MVNKKLIVGLSIALSCVLSFLSASVRAELPVQEPKPTMVLVPKWPQHQGGHLWAGVSVETVLLSTTFRAASLSVGYYWKFFGLDVRGRFGNTQFGSIGVLADPSDLYSKPADWLEVTRDSNDPWSFTTIEPGFTYLGSLFNAWLPRLAEKARIGYAFGTYTDSINGINFTPKLVSVEAGLHYQLTPRSPLAVELSAIYYFGKLANPVGVTTWETSVQVSWLNTSLSLVFWF